MESKPLWVLLHGSDAPARTSPPHARVVLLHGWLQTHDCWLATATELRDNFGHDVLLLDLWDHGHSTAPSADVMSLEGYVALVSDRLAAIGWDSGPPISMAGCSMGAAVAARYAAAHSGRVARLTLITPPGLPEPWYMPCHPVRILAKAVVAAAPAQSSLVHKLRVIRTTPEYGVPLDALFELVERGALRLTVYLAGLDIVHSPHLAYWRAAEARVNTNRATSSADPASVPAAGMRVVYLPGRAHWGVCSGLHALGLHRDETLWHDRCCSELSRPPHGTASTPTPVAPGGLLSRL